MSYEQFFGLNDAPFSLAPDPRYLFESASHAQALQQLTYAMERREPLLVVTGEIGTGKTLLCRTVLQRAGRRVFVSVIHNPLLERDEFLKQLLQDFGIVSADRATAAVTGSRHDLVHALEDFLSSLVALDAHAVVIIDEAQHIQPDVLEQIRLLSNIDAPDGTRLQIILVGQIDLETLLARPDLRQFQQRVSRWVRLKPLAEPELAAYVDHRLSVGRAGGSPLAGAGDLARALSEWEGTVPDGGVSFSHDALAAVWNWSGGLPRVVNLLCDRSLEEAYARQVRTIDADVVAAAATALQLNAAAVSVPDALVPAAAPPRKTASQPLVAAAAIAVVAGAAATVWFLSQRTAPPAANGAPAPSINRPPAATTPPARTPPPVATPATAPAAPTVAPPAAPAAAAPAAAAVASPPGFGIIVASFRTEARAAAVAAQVAAAALPVRQREAAGWQQVIAGPFASRVGAETARAQLERAGLTGTKIVPPPQ